MVPKVAVIITSKSWLQWYTLSKAIDTTRIMCRQMDRLASSLLTIYITNLMMCLPSAVFCHFNTVVVSLLVINVPRVTSGNFTHLSCVTINCWNSLKYKKWNNSHYATNTLKVVLKQLVEAIQLHMSLTLWYLYYSITSSLMQLIATLRD